jgi:hypothetical protein
MAGFAREIARKFEIQAQESEKNLFPSSHGKMVFFYYQEASNIRSSATFASFASATGTLI